MDSFMMNGRTSNEPVAASKIDDGTDVINFGELTRKLARNIEGHNNASVYYRHEVLDFRQLENNNGKLKSSILKMIK